jgi:hypothetical protein
MRMRILDLDNSLPPQEEFLACWQPDLFPLQPWGPSIRMACSFGRFRRFEKALSNSLGHESRAEPAVTFCGSGDFHHVSLALVRRLSTPINLLVLDNHPDWMRYVPFLHCGTWLYHAARLPHVERIFHVGGDVDFDNYYQWMAPWSLLRSGKITVFPAIRRFERGEWSAVRNEPLRPYRETYVSQERVEDLLRPCHADLARRPLYISLDKDVLQEKDAVVNWDSGHLTLAEVQTLLAVFLRAAGGNLAGMDIVGDWSPIKLKGWLQHLMHVTEHPALRIDAADATRRNQQINLALIDGIQSHLAPGAAFKRACRRSV